MSMLSWAKHKWDVHQAERECDKLRTVRITDNVEAQKKFRKLMEISPLLVERMSAPVNGSSSSSSSSFPAGGLPTPEYKRTPYVPPIKNLVCSDLIVRQAIAKDSAFGGAFTSEGSGPAYFTGMGFPASRT